MGGKSAPAQPAPEVPKPPAATPDPKANADAAPPGQAKTSFATQEAVQAEQGQTQGLGSTTSRRRNTRRDPASVAASSAPTGNLGSSAVLTG